MTHPITLYPRRPDSFKRVGLASAMALAMLAGLVPFGPGPSEAEARVGLPWTPLSVAGVARRTAVRRSVIYLNRLPAACARVAVNGVVVWRCGSTYYRAYGNRFVVVNVR